MKEGKQMKVIVSAGGTGGHIYPAVSVIEEITNNGGEVLYIGTKNRMESKIVPSLGYKYVGIDIYGLSKNIFKDIKNIKNIIKSYKQCVRIIKEFKPDAVLGFGGYVTFPVMLAAHKLKIKTGIHEQNSIPGKTNKMLGKIVDKVFISFKESGKYFDSNKVVFSSNPTRERAIKIRKFDKTKLGFDKNKKLIVIVMGSLGSTTVNTKLKEYLKSFNESDTEILFIAGKNNYNSNITKEINNKKVKVVEFFDNLPGIMKSADLIISRAGASTITEIEALNKPAILIPSPYVANNHQYYNAKSVVSKGVAYMIEEKDLTTESLNKTVKEIMDKTKQIKDSYEVIEEINSTKTIYNELVK